MQAEAEGAMDAEYAAEVTSAEPVSKAKAEPETEPETDPVAIEKQELKHQIADLERQLKSARGGLIEAQDSLKDAGEAGYMLLAADFERFRLRAKDEMGVQSGIGKLNTARQLLPFIETFSSLQGAEAESTEAAAIHSYYGGIYKQLMQLLEQWEVSSFNAPVGEVYDPRLHSKASTVEREQAAGTILEQAACGWMMGGEVLMQAECVISSGPPLPPVKEEAETMSEGATEEAAEAEEAVEAEPASE